MDGYKKGDILAFPKTINGDILDFFGIGISLLEEFEDLYCFDNAKLPIDPSEIIHVGVVFDDNYYAESTLSGVKLTPLVKLKSKEHWHCILKEDLRTKIYEQEMKFNMFIYNQIGKPYDFLQIPKFIPYILSFKKLFKPKDDDKLNVCSEMINREFRKVGIKSTIANPSAATPASVFSENWYSLRVRRGINA